MDEKDNNLDLTPKQLRENVKNIVEIGDSVKIIPRKRLNEDIFNLNAYSIYLEGNSLQCVPLFEVENSDPDGVFIILETNFNVPKV